VNLIELSKGIRPEVMEAALSKVWALFNRWRGLLHSRTCSLTMDQGNICSELSIAVSIRRRQDGTSGMSVILATLDSDEMFRNRLGSRPGGQLGNSSTVGNQSLIDCYP
jgi:hypothetical protein